MKAKTHFRRMGPNFMTPDPVRYVDTKLYMIELSEGQFLDDHLWGVSVSARTGERDHDRSQMFRTLEDAEAHIAQLEMEDL